MLNLFYLINGYVKYASLRSDMADRIMYSTIPHFDPNKMYSTDMVALDKAVSGAKSTLIHGAFVCQEECSDYRGDSSLVPKRTLIPTTINNETINVFISMFSTMEKLFGEKDKWIEAMGGERWATIANFLKEIAINYKKYIQADQKNSEDKIEAGKKVIVYLNAFDGLAHNTGGIIDKLLDREVESNTTGLPKDKYYNELHEIYKLMDIKELKNPEDVANLVHKEINNPIVYKDYIDKVKQNRFKYFNSEKEKQIKKELKQIQNRKEAKRFIAEDIKNFIYLENKTIPEVDKSPKHKLKCYIMDLDHALEGGKYGGLKNSDSAMQKILDLKREINNKIKTATEQELKDMNMKEIFNRILDSYYNLLNSL